MDTRDFTQDRAQFISPVMLLIYLTVAALILGQITWAGAMGKSYFGSVLLGAGLLTILSLFRWLLNKMNRRQGPINLLDTYFRWYQWQNFVKVLDIYGLKLCIASLFYCFGLVGQGLILLLG